MKFINVQTQGNVKIVSLNRPEVKNAFHPEMISEITSFFKNESADSQTAFIILKAEGTAFCAGADLNWMKLMADYTYDENIEDSKKLWELFESIQSCEIPVVAVAQGAVFGGGLGLLVCCDYVFAEEKAQFCFSEVRLGLSPAVISTFFSRKIQDAFFRPYMLSAEVFSQTEAMRMGLVQKTYKDVISMEEVIKIFSPNESKAMRETKKLLNVFLSSAEREMQMLSAAKVISERRRSAEGQLRLQDYLNKVK